MRDCQLSHDFVYPRCVLDLTVFPLGESGVADGEAASLGEEARTLLR